MVVQLTKCCVSEPLVDYDLVSDSGNTMAGSYVAACMAGVHFTLNSLKCMHMNGMSRACLAAF